MKYFIQYIRCQVEIRTKQLSNARPQPHLKVDVSVNVHIVSPVKDEVQAALFKDPVRTAK
jgi:hypothetical protein